MNRPEDALNALTKAFELGYRAFAHLEHDFSFEGIRDLPQFQALVDKYKAIHRKFVQSYNSPAPAKESVDSTVTELAFTRHSGGTFEVPCTINGLALRMVFDTGSSDITISSVEANFMMKNNYLSDKDVRGKRNYMTASGEIRSGTVINLREVTVGDIRLKDVEASVVESQRAPLLLGQSAMERFGTITIDNDRNKLIIKH